MARLWMSGSVTPLVTTSHVFAPSLLCRTQCPRWGTPRLFAPTASPDAGRHHGSAREPDDPKSALPLRPSADRGDGSQTCMGVFLSSGFLVCCRFLVWSGKAVPRPVACDQVRGARGKVSRDRNASVA